ncbi:M14 family metallopeptidase [Bacillus sp. B-jedd]|uniref:M14 family metallopeptidase n=1 Tax=Bacillus sp. B-jedd TaxID=1476857 RepID=UPI00051558D1|nr:M14 family metallocarboxypeptidase [Bacillus sp. B-jedd]CEG27856.1 gamma-D-glutamyl-L-diamino acid endopeptidase I [Bacillus sp. B-jedd]
MRIPSNGIETLGELAEIFNLPVDLISDSNRDEFIQGAVPRGTINIPGYTLLPGRHINWESVKIAIGQQLDALKTNSSIGRFLQEREFIPWKITSPCILGRMAYSSVILERDLEILKEAYPFITLTEIGKSVLGNPIKEVKIGRGKKKLHFNASFHANEWITSGILMDLMNAYLLALTNNYLICGIGAMSVYNTVELSVVPMVNPDGVNLVLEGPMKSQENRLMNINHDNRDFSGWKANINGVDLNNQFPANWEIEKKRKEPKSPAPRDYPGNRPLSEPEALAMAKLVENGNFDMVFAFHTQGEEFYWGYNGKEPEESLKIASILSSCSGYKAVRTIDSHAGFKDWFIQEYNRPGFTIELGKGINPLPLSQFDKIYDNVRGLFFSALTL